MPQQVDLALVGAVALDQRALHLCRRREHRIHAVDEPAFQRAQLGRGAGVVHEEVVRVIRRPLGAERRHRARHRQAPDPQHVGSRPVGVSREDALDRRHCERERVPSDPGAPEARPPGPRDRRRRRVLEHVAGMSSPGAPERDALARTVPGRPETRQGDGAREPRAAPAVREELLGDDVGRHADRVPPQRLAAEHGFARSAHACLRSGTTVARRGDVTRSTTASSRSMLRSVSNRSRTWARPARPRARASSGCACASMIAAARRAG